MDDDPLFIYPIFLVELHKGDRTRLLPKVGSRFPTY
jgi:hypothetical protein